MSLTVVVGTAKGGFILRTDDRQSWSMSGPFFKGWKVTAITRDAQGTFLCGTASDVYGAAIHKSTDLENWTQVKKGPSYPKEGTAGLKQIWKILPHERHYWAGVADAGLFRSDDDGDTWTAVEGLNGHRTRESWCPGAGGLCAHSILVDNASPERMWVGISAVGVFRSDDGGSTWHPRNDGVPAVLPDKDHPDIGFCVHAMAQDPDDPNLIYRQDHKGMFRTRDGGDHWENIENGLYSGFGFPLAQDPSTRRLFAVPLESDEYRIPEDGKLRVFKSDNGGDSWEAVTAGLPQQNAYIGVLRGAFDVDGLNPCGAYFGTTSGQIYASVDNGDSWHLLPGALPRIQCVTAFTD
jgi:hypothetical protein